MAPRESKIGTSRVTAAVIVCLSVILGHLKPVECVTNDQETACSFSQSLTVGKRFRVDDKFFSTNSFNLSYPPEHARNLTNLTRCWCSKYLPENSVDELQSNGRGSESPWLEVQFGATVIIKNLEISGYASNDNGQTIWYFVRKFNIYYGDVGDEELKPITTVGENGENIIKNFEVNHPQKYQLPLDEPIVTQRLRIVPLEWNDNSCMSLEATGCLVEGPTCLINPLLSSNRSLLPQSEEHIIEGKVKTIESFHSTDLVDNTGDEFYFFKYIPWCFETDFNDHPYVDLKFNEPIWLTHMETRGHPLDISSRGHITNISLQYAKDENTEDDSAHSSLEDYSDLDGKYILAANGKQQFRTFWKPPKGSVFRFNINNGTAGTSRNTSYCWNILLYGCRVEQEISLAQASQLLGDSTVPMQVGILIGSVVGLITLSALVIVVVVGVIKWTKRSRQDNENKPTTSSEQSRDRSVSTLSDTIVESLAYTWTRNESIDTSSLSVNASIQSGNELQTSHKLREPLLKPIAEEP